MNDEYAVIDVGSNSTLLLIAKKNTDYLSIKRPLVILKEESVTTRLAEGLKNNNFLLPNAIERTVKVIHSYFKQCIKFKIPPKQIKIIGTYALRQAENSYQVKQLLLQKCDATLEILSPREEAYYSALGAASQFQDFTSPNIIFDIGGGSTEIIENFIDYNVSDAQNTNMNEINFVSLNIGCISLTEKYFLNNSMLSLQVKERLLKELKMLILSNSDVFATLSKFQNKTGIGIGGTMTTLAAILKEINTYDEKKINETELSRKMIEKIFFRLWNLKLDKRKNVSGLSSQRAEIILAGIAICKTIMDCFNLKSIIVSTYGIRHGIILAELK